MLPLAAPEPPVPEVLPDVPPEGPTSEGVPDLPLPDVPAEVLPDVSLPLPEVALPAPLEPLESTGQLTLLEPIAPGVSVPELAVALVPEPKVVPAADGGQSMLLVAPALVEPPEALDPVEPLPLESVPEDEPEVPIDPLELPLVPVEEPEEPDGAEPGETIGSEEPDREDSMPGDDPVEDD